jgi:hypothetical protein
MYQGLERADALLLQLQPNTDLPIRSKSGIWCWAFAKIAQLGHGRELIKKDLYCGNRVCRGESEQWDPSDLRAVYTGASAVFKILQKRPAILEPQLKRPAAATVSTVTSVVDGRQAKHARCLLEPLHRHQARPWRRIR